MRYRNRGVGSDKLHSSAFREMNKWASFDDEVFGNGNARAIVTIQACRGFKSEECQDASAKRVVNGQIIGAIVLGDIVCRGICLYHCISFGNQARAGDVIDLATYMKLVVLRQV